ncbi:MAG: hypothetical protein PHC97_03230 [Patescibacteria group bacterium]|nr:hypothetical protein [Patescibacteria group bacterium]
MTTKQVVTDEQYGRVSKRTHELLTRFARGSVEFQPVMDGLQQLIEGKQIFEAKKIPKLAVDVSSLVREWQDFYRQVYGIEADFSSLRIPEHQKGFDRLIIVVPGMTPQRLYDKCKEMFPCWKWTEADLDKIVTSDRTAKTGAYAVWFRDRVEADEEMESLSANTLKKRGIVGTTLEERFLYEQKYFLETVKHPDINNVTLCSGSRYSDGDVPYVYWGDGRMRVGGCSPGNSHDNLRSRSVVL